MSGTDHLTVLTTVDGKLATKRIRRAADGEWHVTPYGSAMWFSVRQIAVDGIVSLGQALHDLERDPDEHDCWLSGRAPERAAQSFVIRGEPRPGTDLARTRRLLHDQIEPRTGEVCEATFQPQARRWIALDFDDLPAPVWDEEKLARRGGMPPAPIDPAKDWVIVCNAAASTLPAEFHDSSAFWQLTSSAGIKPGIRLRLWFWLDRPVTDAEAKRWLSGAPVDASLYSPVQAHYTAAPIFDPPELDPVPLRSGYWWRHTNTVTVPELPEPPPAPELEIRWTTPGNADQFLVWRAERYAEAALRGVETATAGTRHHSLIAAAVRLFSLADLGLLNHDNVTRRLDAAGAVPLSAQERRLRCTAYGNRLSANQDAIAWARARHFSARPARRVRLMPIDMGAARAQTKQAGNSTDSGTAGTNPNGQAGPQQHQWPVEPVDIIGAADLVGWPELTADCIPEPLHRYVMVESERLNVDPCPIAAHVLAACSTLCSDKWKVRSKRHDTAYKEQPRLWICVVKDVGSRGTAMIRSAFWPVRRIEDEFRQEYDRELALWLQKEESRKKGDPPNPGPHLKRLTTQDATIEAAADILSKGTKYSKLTVLCDELSGFLGGFNRYDKGGAARAFWLESYDGGPRMIDRVIRGYSFVPNWSAVFAGNIQPRRLAGMGKSLIDDGMFQRFLTIHTRPSDIGVDDDVPVDPAAGRDYEELLRALKDLEPEHDAENKYPAAYFDDEAVAVRRKFMNLVDRLRVDPTFPTIIRETAPKWGGTLARLSLIFHLVQLAEKARLGESISPQQRHRVTVTTVNMAATFLRRIALPNLFRLGFETMPEEGAPAGHARWIAGHILAHDLDRVIGRDVGRHYRPLTGKPEEIEQAMEVLVHAGWADRLQTRHDSLQWHVNPAVHKVFAAAAAAEKERRERVVKAIRRKVSEL